VIPAGERSYTAMLDLSESTLTKFASDNPAVATAETHGQVTTVVPGSTELTIMNGKARLEIQITVIKKDEFQERVEKLLPFLKEKQQ
jgi:hypothetical protein